MASAERYLGLYERFSLARTNVGVAPTVVLHASFRHSYTKTITTTEHSLSTRRQALERAITSLLNEFPLLRGRIKNRHCRKPSYTERKSTGVDDILQVIDLRKSDNYPSEDDLLKSRLEYGLVLGDGIDVAEGPSWRVVYYHQTGLEKEGLMLVVNHTLSDGLGAKNLFAQLVQRTLRPSSPEASHLGLANFSGIPKSQEESVPGLQKMSWSFYFNIIWTELVRPSLPPLFGFNSRPVAFLNPPLVLPFQQPTALRIVRIPNSLIAKTKARARKGGVSTLHPVLQTALFASLLSIWSDKPGHEQRRHINMETAISMRDEQDLGHPYATGNYVSSLSSPPSFEEATLASQFFPLACSYAAHLSSTVERDRAKQSMLALALIPDPPSSAKSASSNDTEKDTGWEIWLRKKMSNTTCTWSCTIDASNLGLFPIAKDVAEEIEDLGWAQPGSAMGAAIGSNIMSSPSSEAGEMIISFSYRRSTLEDSVLDEICASFSKVMQRLGSSDEIDESLLTLGNLTRDLA